ncbi:hypothetical protein chiPu_0023807 [Chiloscyllium punctatum]|uniref:Uncharacterized protein n=1 Tax=Chiloscyllium punctatum TaxID=137246 RepID=A0A401TAZ3_CHIPU|nr:hypothetical protein [Chiloscyllium punctatum]
MAFPHAVGVLGVATDRHCPAMGRYLMGHSLLLSGAACRWALGRGSPFVISDAPALQLEPGTPASTSPNTPGSPTMKAGLTFGLPLGAEDPVNHRLIPVLGHKDVLEHVEGEPVVREITQ